MVVSTPYGDLRHGEVSATVGCTPYIYIYINMIYITPHSPHQVPIV